MLKVPNSPCTHYWPFVTLGRQDEYTFWPYFDSTFYSYSTLSSHFHILSSGTWFTVGSQFHIGLANGSIGEVNQGAYLPYTSGPLTKEGTEGKQSRYYRVTDELQVNRL